MEHIKFPVSLEAFIAYQEAGIGRKLGQNERRCLEELVPVINGFYRFGAVGESEAMSGCLDRLEDCFAQEAENALLTQFFKSMRWWMCYAYQQGRAEAGKGATA